MKYSIIVLVALFAIAMARPDVSVIRQDSDVQPESFHFGVETSDGFQHDAEGHLKDVGTDHEAIVVRGSYQFVADDGVTYTVNYVADENGFQPQGAHIAVA